jgi:hypothetical protein
MLDATIDQESFVFRDLSSIEPPGEDALDLPLYVGWLVAACTWVRNLALVRGEPPTRVRLRKTEHLLGTVAGEVP